MNRPLRTYALIAAAAVVVGILENTLFGADSGGAKHQISVAFFFLAVAGIVALVVIGIVAAARRAGSSTS